MGRYGGKQPSLKEMLDDPIVRLLMARDGVTRAEIEDLIDRLRTARAVRRDGGPRSMIWIKGCAAARP